MIRPTAFCGRPAVTRFAFAVSLLGVLRPEGAVAQQGPARSACGADIGRVCPGVDPGEGRITACVSDHFTQLSPPCQIALTSGVTITRACKVGYQQSCAGIEPGGGRSQACMRDHFAVLDEGCRKALLLGKLQKQ